MKKILIIPILLFCSVVQLFGAAAEEEKPKKISFNLYRLISGQNIERPQPVIRDTIDLERRETVSGKTFGELRDAASERGVPMFLVAMLSVSSKGFVMDYLDGFRIFEEAAHLSSAERSLPWRKKIYNYINRHYLSHAHLFFSSSSDGLLFYPNGVISRELEVEINGKLYNSVEGIINLVLNQDEDERYKSALCAFGYFMQHPSITAAKVAKFWLDQGTTAEDRVNAKAVDDYLATHEDASAPGEYVYLE